MKIGIVLYPTFGGSGIVATELGKELAQKGYEVHFITYKQPVRLDAFGENVFYHEVAVHEYPLFDYFPSEITLSSKLVDVVKHEKLDLLHVHYAIPHASAAYMAKQVLASQGIKIPFITTLHGTDITLVGRDPSFEPVIEFVIDQSDAVTSVSKSLKQDTYAHFKVHNEIQVIPNFIRTEKYNVPGDQALRSKYAPNGEKILMHISNFRPVKRVQDIVKAFSIIREKIPSKLIFIGDGPERYKAESLCREIGTCDDTFFLGKFKSTEGVLSNADLFLLTSETESFGVSALEAMASGVPVVSTNSGGLPEVNVDGFSGYLCEVGDVESIASNSIKILEDEHVYSHFKANALKRAEKFDIKAILPMYEKLYERVVSR